MPAFDQAFLGGLQAGQNLMAQLAQLGQNAERLKLEKQRADADKKLFEMQIQQFQQKQAAQQQLPMLMQQLMAGPQMRGPGSQQVTEPTQPMERQGPPRQTLTAFPKLPGPPVNMQPTADLRGVDVSQVPPSGADIPIMAETFEFPEQFVPKEPTKTTTTERQGPPQQVPSMTPQNLAQFIQLARQAGEDPGTLLKFMSMMSPEIQNLLQEGTTVELGKGAKLLQKKKGTFETVAENVPPEDLTGTPDKQHEVALTSKAYEMFGDQLKLASPTRLPWNQVIQVLSPDQIVKVTQDVEQEKSDRAIEQSRQTGVGAARVANLKEVEAFETVPLSQTGEAHRYYRFDPSTANVSPLGNQTWSGKQAVDHGYMRINEKFTSQLEKYQEIQFRARPKIGRLREIAEQILTAEGGIESVQRGLSLTWDKLFQSGKPVFIRNPITNKMQKMTVGEAARLYQKEIASFKTDFGRSFAGLRGAASDKDIEAVEAAFASLYDSAAVATALYDEIDQSMFDAQRAAIATIFGAPSAQQMPMITTRRTADQRTKDVMDASDVMLNDIEDRFKAFKLSPEAFIREYVKALRAVNIPDAQALTMAQKRLKELGRGQ